MNNYNLFAQKGKSSAFTGFLAGICVSYFFVNYSKDYSDCSLIFLLSTCKWKGSKSTGNLVYDRILIDIHINLVYPQKPLVPTALMVYTKKTLKRES